MLLAHGEPLISIKPQNKPFVRIKLTSDNDGHITKEEMLKVVQSMMSLVERSDNFTRYESPKAKVDFIFSVMDEVIYYSLQKEFIIWNRYNLQFRMEMAN